MYTLSVCFLKRGGKRSARLDHVKIRIGHKNIASYPDSFV